MKRNELKSYVYVHQKYRLISKKDKIFQNPDKIRIMSEIFKQSYLRVNYIGNLNTLKFNTLNRKQKYFHSASSNVTMNINMKSHRALPVSNSLGRYNSILKKKCKIEISFQNSPIFDTDIKV